MHSLVPARLFSLFACAAMLPSAFAATPYNDPNPQRYELTARASEIDPNAKEHPEIDFVFTKNGKPSDTEKAVVDTRVAPQGKLVIWLMGYSAPLFERVSGYGLHGIQVHYANGWFGKLSKLAGDDDKYTGKIRLEAATGEDFTPAVTIPKADGMMERSYQFVKWLSQKNPQGKWEQFLTEDGKGLRWDKVIISGSSHGSTTSARFALHQKVDRVVMFCGPRDQLENWQALPSATPKNRFFGFSHVLDGGWTGDHYCRSWELLGLHQFGPIVNVDKVKAPYGSTRRLITDADVKNDAKKAHSSVVPGGAAVKDAEGKFIHEDVWRYLFLHPVEETGSAVPADPECLKEQKK
nr:hypothetical protein [Roseimicrobium sp. ORNL1]